MGFGVIHILSCYLDIFFWGHKNSCILGAKKILINVFKKFIYNQKNFLIDPNESELVKKLKFLTILDRLSAGFGFILEI